jgi:hypothetical protein
VRRELDEGHVVGNHTYDHIDLTATDTEQARRQLLGFTRSACRWSRSSGCRSPRARPTASHRPNPTGDYALSDQTRREVDLSAQELATMAYARAHRLMEMNRGCLDDLAANALEPETLTREDLDEIFAAHELRRTLKAPATTLLPVGRQAGSRGRETAAGDLLRNVPKRGHNSGASGSVAI